MSESLEQVSVTSGDRVLTGVGVSEESLRETVERHAPAEPSDIPESTPPAPSPARNEQGQFAKPPKGRERFQALTAERDTERQKREAAERERDELKARLSAPPPVQAPVPAPAPTPEKPPPVFQFAQYDAWVQEHPDATWDDWNRAAVQAQVNHEWQQRQSDLSAQIRKELAAAHADQQFWTHVDQVTARAKATYPDFETVIASGPGARIVLGRDAEMGTARVKYIAQLPQAEHVQYAIAKDASLAQRLAGMSDLEFGVTVAGLAPSNHLTAAPTPTPRTPTPPQPYQPVGSGTQTTVPQSSELVSKAGFDFDKSGYRERRAAERGVKLRR